MLRKVFLYCYLQRYGRRGESVEVIKGCLSLIFALVALVYRKGFKFYKVFDFRFAYAQCSSDDEIIFSTIGIWKGKYPNNVFFCKCIGLK
jgi:hypothetical protein